MVLSFPLIARELRVQSRNRSTYGARVGWGLAAVALLGFFSWNFPAQAANGKFVLSGIHICLGVMLFLLAPIGAADAISREKREGTLRLLLLTRLTPTQVVLGKLAAHAIRLFYLGFMMLPFLIIPILMGGVAIQDFVLSVAILVALIALGLGAGLIASAMFTSFAAALACALFLAVLFAMGVSALVTNGLLTFLPNRFPSDLPLFIRIFVLGPALLTFPVGAKELVTNYFSPSPWIFPFIEAGLLLLPILLLIFAVSFCARKVAQHSDFTGETKRQAAFRR
ncbi:MAG: ABC transporter permease subunit, partial [Limisphaerales bacterium]